VLGHLQATLRLQHRKAHFRVSWLEGVVQLLLLLLLLRSSFLNPAVEVDLHLELGLRDLIGDIVVRLRLVLGHDFTLHFLAILQLLHSLLVLRFMQLEFLLQSLLLLGLLLHARLGHPELVGHLLLLGDPAELQVAALAEAEQVLRNVGVHLHLLRLRLPENVVRRDVTGVEDRVRAAREGRDGEDQPVLIGEVLLLHVDPALGIVLAHQLLVLINKHQLRRRCHADAEGDLILADG